MASSTPLAIRCTRICGAAGILQRHCGSLRGARRGIPVARFCSTTTARKDSLLPAPYSYHSLALASLSPSQKSVRRTRRSRGSLRLQAAFGPLNLLVRPTGASADGVLRFRGHKPPCLNQRALCRSRTVSSVTNGAQAPSSRLPYHPVLPSRHQALLP